MLKPHKPLIFVDSNVLIEGLLADYATAKAVVVFARHKKIKLVTCEQVIVDIETELIDKTSLYKEFSGILHCWEEMKEKIYLSIVPDPPEAEVLAVNKMYLPLMRHQADIPILTAALIMKPQPDFILSGNRKHLMPPN